MIEWQIRNQTSFFSVFSILFTARIALDIDIFVIVDFCTNTEISSWISVSLRRVLTDWLLNDWTCFENSLIFAMQQDFLTFWSVDVYTEWFERHVVSRLLILNDLNDSSLLVYWMIRTARRFRSVLNDLNNTSFLVCWYWIIWTKCRFSFCWYYTLNDSNCTSFLVSRHWFWSERHVVSSLFEWFEQHVVHDLH